MTLSRSHAYFSAEEYLELEQISPIKHEYIQGEVYAMAGASDAHVTITINLVTLLRNHIRGTNCRVYSGDMKVRVEEANAFYYPDLMVTCDERDRNSQYLKKYPRLIVEVLSSTTANFDRGDKFIDYQKLSSLEEYVLISQDREKVECFRRDSQGSWSCQTYERGEDVRLLSIDFSCTIAQLYEDVDLNR